MIAVAFLLMAAAQGPNCASPVTQADMNQCADRDYQAADAALNRQWKVTSEAMKTADREAGAQDGRPGYAASLLEAQRAWLKYRDTHCVSEGYQARGGSMEPMLVSACRAELTKQRTEQLRKLAESN
ncbi:lysozyme inhibitor LprI family protein [Sphingomonas sp. LaA6.9]|uniref:lysozyme inhibitor LprI family protein n=1 Tax=Sphingomonas sp. LaA6.9 TaxID=2919914 RepID=UPI001F500882|nr:lysozyme inhibitor LprI family protein [Sphingomonas sp. LaA6.9]MCJ8159584.1 lysozyme inhibitor LprI family protein [Sphingomonas sp. LaA6.9]